MGQLWLFSFYQYWLRALILILHYLSKFSRVKLAALQRKNPFNDPKGWVSSLTILVSGITFLFLLPTYSRHSIMQQWWLCVPYQLISPAMVYCPHSQWLRALIWAVLHPAKFSVVLLATVERKILSPAWRLRINSLWIPDTGLILILRCMPFTNNGYAHRAPITVIAV